MQGDLSEYKSIPFWSWNNALDEEELVKQIEEMHAAGIGGFIMHARTGLRDEYLGEKWFSCIDACLKKAKALGMEGWIYDENGWPSGFVGGKLLENENFRARFLRYSVGEWDESAFAVFIEDETLGFKRITKAVEGVEKYHRVYLIISPANSDILNPDVVDAFIAETHEKYYERFSERFGKELVGFFTDEPQFYRWETPYTPTAEKVFAADGEDIRDGLIWLFIHDERGYAFRTKYYQTLNTLYVEVFYKKLYEWCEAHGCKLTGHSVEENGLHTQMWGGCAVSPSYEYEHIPGIDSLCRFCMEELPVKQAASVAAQLGKKQILTETFACTGYDVTPTELKYIGESQYFQGVNKMCQHLYPYSIAAQGKVDHPPVFGPHGGWGESFKRFNDYFTRLGAIVGNTQECVDIAILHPMRDIWLEYVRSEEEGSVKETEESFDWLLKELRSHGVTFHFIDERILARHGKVEKEGLRVGERVYGTLLLPKMRSIAATTYELLQAYKGKLCVLQTPTLLDGKTADITLSSNCTLEEIEKSAEIPYACADKKSLLTHRRGEIGEFLFIKNMADSESVVRVDEIANGYRILDLENLEEKSLPPTLTLRAREGLILLRSEKAQAARAQKQRVDITERFRVTGITDNYFLLDYAQLRKGNGEFGERYPVQGLSERLIFEDYQGEITVRQVFTVAEKMPLKLIMEKAEWIYARCNGQELCFRPSDIDVNFVEADLPSVREGENELVYSLRFWQHDGVRFALFDPLATESLRNCLYYDTSIEPAYLQGDFVVNADMVLCKRKNLPPVTDALCKEGYPFFKGEVTLTGSLSWDGESRVTLGIDGRFLVARVRINGREIALALDTKKEITSLLQEGENQVELVLRSSLRNLFGPHHCSLGGGDPKAAGVALVPDFMGVGPYNFTFRGGWATGYPREFTGAYQCVSFGIKNIYLEIEGE